MFYIQCEIEYSNSDKYIKTTSWLPQKYAKKGKILKLKYNNEWSNGWGVTKVYEGVKIPEERVIKMRDYYKKQREVSDI